MLSPLAVSHAAVLRFIHATPDTTANAIAAATQRVPSNVRRDLPKLEKAGLITVAPLSLTDQGVATLAVMDGQAAPLPPEAMEEGFRIVSWDQIKIGALNPRKEFDGLALLELADDILARGLKQNLLVRPMKAAEHQNQESYELIAGERRWRAIGLLIKRGDADPAFPIPVKVEAMDDKEHALAALLENLQRVDLNPLEEAVAFDQLVNMNGWSTAQVAEKVSKTQRFVQLRLQLMKLTDDQKARLVKGDMTVKDAIKAIANRPEPVVVTPVQLLALALIWTNAYPDPSAHSSYWRKGECHESARDQPIIAALIAAGLVEAEEPSPHEPRHQLGTSYRGYLALEQNAIELTRAENEEGRHGAMMSLDNAAYALDKVTSTDAMALKQLLGKPAINSKAVQKLIDEKQASELAWKEKQDADEAAKIAAREKVAQEQAAGHALLVRIRAFEADAPTMSRAEFAEAFNALLAERGYIGPFSIALYSLGTDNWGRALPTFPTLFDGKGNPIVGAGSQLEATRRLQAIALNHAIGQAVVYSGGDLKAEEVEDDQDDQDDEADDAAGEWEPDTEEEFVVIIVEQFQQRYGQSAEHASDLAKRAYARWADDGNEYGDDSSNWDRLAAKIIADGWAEDLPDTLTSRVDVAGDE